MSIYVTRSSMPDFEEYCEEIKDIWDTHMLTNMGEKHKKFQKQLEEYLHVPYVTLFTNGHLALEGIIEACGFERGSEIITTPFTFASTTHAIVRSGMKPVFCDIKKDDFTIDETKIEDLITDKTVAIMPVHVYGKMCNVDAIDAIAKKHSLKVIYDAAHAFGVNYKGVSSACYGDASMFSFHATKVFNSIEGGAVCFKDPELLEVLEDLKNFGTRGSEDCAWIGGNAKMTEFQAAMGICNLRHLENEIAKRKAVTERYNMHLKDVEGLLISEPQKDTESNYAYYPVIFDGFRMTRNEVYELLKRYNINTRKYFYPLTSDLSCYKGEFGDSSVLTPVAKYMTDRVLTLPLYADLPLEEVDRICEIILNK